MLYMIIETFRQGAEPVYARYHEKGRLAPEGLTYLDSWVEEGGMRCFQLMRADDRALIEQWTARWDDLVAFEVVPVVPSAEAAERYS